MVAHQRNERNQGGETGRLSGTLHDVQHTVQEAMQRPAEMVKEYPLSSMLMCFGIGLGVGVVLSQTVCSSLMETFEPEPSTVEKLKRQVYDAVTHVISPSMLKQIQNYTG